MNTANSAQSAESVLTDLRESIARIDEAIVQLLAARVNTGREIALVKTSADIPIHDAEQESRVIQRAVSCARDLALPEADVAELFRRVIGMTRGAQYRAS
ncbi:MAG: chorismate mutase [Gemmatimonadaceae bacterium]